MGPGQFHDGITVHCPHTFLKRCFDTRVVFSEIHCPPPKLYGPYSIVGANSSTYAFGARVVVMCDAGYAFKSLSKNQPMIVSPSETYYCNENMQWTPTPTYCTGEGGLDWEAA